MIRAGIVGLGRIGHGFGRTTMGDPLSHSESYAALPGVEIALGLDPDPVARARFAQRFPRALVLADARAVPADLSLDVVSVATGTAERRAGVEAALNFRPKVMLCEKPLGGTAAEAEEIAALVRAAGCTLVVNFSRRWAPVLSLLRAAVAVEGALGPPARVVIRFGGGLIHNGTHFIDLLLALFGPPTASRPLAAGPGDAARGLSLSWPNGLAAVMIDVGSLGYSVGEGELWSGRGVARLALGGRRLVFQPTTDGPWPGFREPGPEHVLTERGLDGHMLRAAQEAVNLARYGGVPTCGATDGVAPLALIEHAWGVP